MSYFSPPPVAADMDRKKIRSYVMMLNRQLQYCLSGISPEDNFSLEAMVKYLETDEKIAQLEVSMDGFLAEFKNLETEVETSFRVMDDQIQMKVSQDELCSEISMSPGLIAFRSGYITIDTKNFKLSQDGTAEFSGAVTGGSININNNFTVDADGHTNIASGAYTGKIACSGLLVTETLITYGDCSVEGTISCASMSVSGSVSCEEVYQTSDERLKSDIREISGWTCLELVLGLRPVVFRYTEDGEESMGFIAQEVNALQERTGTHLPMTGTGADGYLQIPYASYAALIAGAIRMQQEEIERLEKEVGL